MLHRDLRDYIAAIESAGELCRVRREVDPDLEIACIAAEVCKLPPDRNKAILFEKVRGSRLPVLMNAFGSERRISIMAGVDNYHGLTERLSGLLELLQQPRKTLVDKLKAIPMLREVSKCFPAYVKRGACQEVVHRGEAIDLMQLPILKTWPMDGGPFITLPLVFTRDPVDGKRNCGMYRMQRYDRRTLGFHVHTHHTGADHIRKAKAQGKDRIEVAVAIGAEPAVIFSAVVPLPPGLDEMIIAGFLNQAPVKMVKCVSVGLEVPASAEVVLEGYVMVDEKRREGPFGDHTGFYSLADDYWVFHCTAVTHRRDAIWSATVVGAPPQEDNHMTSAIERLFLPLMQQPIHEVVDYRLPFEGVAHNLMLVNIKKSYPGQARKVAHAVWGLGQAMFTKLICVGDDTSPPLSDGTAWAKHAARYLDAEHSIETVRGPTETLDHATRALYFGSKVSIDLTRPWSGESRDSAPPEATGTPGDDVLVRTLRGHVPGVTAAYTPFKGEWRHLLLVTLDKRVPRNGPAGEAMPEPLPRSQSNSGPPPRPKQPPQAIYPQVPAAEPGVRDTSMYEHGATAREVIAACWKLWPGLPCAQRVVVFDHGEDLTDLSRLVWLGLSNIDPERDLVFDHIVEDRDGVTSTRRHPRRIGVDCTVKTRRDGFTRDWPIEQTYPEDLVQRIHANWTALGLP